MDRDENLILTRTVHDLRGLPRRIVGSLGALAQGTHIMLQFIGRAAAKSLCLEERRRQQKQLRLEFATSHAAEVLEIYREVARRLAHGIVRSCLPAPRTDLTHPMQAVTANGSASFLQ